MQWGQSVLFLGNFNPRELNFPFVSGCRPLKSLFLTINKFNETRVAANPYPISDCWVMVADLPWSKCFAEKYLAYNNYSWDLFTDHKQNCWQRKLILSKQFCGSHICAPEHRYGGCFGILKYPLGNWTKISWKWCFFRSVRLLPKFLETFLSQVIVCLNQQKFSSIW